MAKKQELTVIAKDQFLDLTDIQKIPEALNAIKGRIEALSNINKTEVRIEVSLGNFGVIKNITEPKALIDAYNYIVSKANNYDKVMPHFKGIAPGVNVPPFTENGHTLEQWQKEIDTAYALLVNKTEIEKYESIYKKMSELVSEDEKKRMALEALKEELASMSIT